MSYLHKSDITGHVQDQANPHGVTKTQIGLSDVENILHKLDATAAPIATDDSGSGYTIGSMWIDVTNNEAYLCEDATVSAAVWLHLTADSAVWGQITGTLSNQTDLQSALDGKSDTSHNHTVGSLSDVTITAIATGELLRWSGTEWQNKTPAEANLSEIGHTHVKADITDSDWISGITAEPIQDLSNVTITTPASGELLKYDGANWINNTLAEAGIAADSHNHTLDGLSNVTITTNTAGEILKWSGTAWINNTLAEAGISATGHTHVKADITDADWISNVVEDTTPQLGGNLDINAKKIVSTANGDIDIEPNGTGNVLLGNFKFDADQAVGAGQDNYVLTYDNASGLISLEAAAGGGLNNVVEDTTPQLGGNLDVQANVINTSTVNGGITLTPNGTGNVTLGTMVFDSDQTIGAGQDNYVLTYDNAAGVISLEAAAGGGGGAEGYHYSGTITTAPAGTGEDSIVIGDGANAYARVEAVVIGKSAGVGSSVTVGNYEICIGRNAKLAGSNNTQGAIAIGQGAGQASGNTSIQNSIFIGYGAIQNSGTWSSTRDGVAIGSYSKIQGDYNVGIGYGAIGGTNSAPYTTYAVAVGANSSAKGDYTVALGAYAQTSADNAIAVGSNVTNSVADSARFGRSTTTGLHSKNNGNLELFGTAAQYVLPTYTVATAPTGTTGGMAYFSDGDAGAACVAVYDGTAWKRISLGATISAT